MSFKAVYDFKENIRAMTKKKTNYNQVWRTNRYGEDVFPLCSWL